MLSHARQGALSLFLASISAALRLCRKARIALASSPPSAREALTRVAPAAGSRGRSGAMSDEEGGEGGPAPYVLEYARSGRSKCKSALARRGDASEALSLTRCAAACKEVIGDGEIRCAQPRGRTSELC